MRPKIHALCTYSVAPQDPDNCEIGDALKQGTVALSVWSDGLLHSFHFVLAIVYSVH